MHSFSQFIQDEHEISYDEYRIILENIYYEKTDPLLEDNIYSLIGYANEKVKTVYNKLRKDVRLLSKEIKISKESVILALINPTIFNIVKAFNYSLRTILSLFGELSDLIKAGLFDILKDISESSGVQAINKGLINFDKFTEKYPILKRVNGPILAILIIFVWLNMTFIGNFKYDLNLKLIYQSIKGSLTLGDFFSRVEGKAILVLFGTGAFVSFPWLGSTVMNITLALIYTGLVLGRRTELAEKIKGKIEKGNK